MHVSGTRPLNPRNLLKSALLLIAVPVGLVAQETPPSDLATGSSPTLAESASSAPKQRTPPALLRPAIQITAQPIQPADSAIEHKLARMERHLKTLFPKSEIDLVVLKNGIAIQGQAASPEDSAAIHEIVRSEFGRTPAPRPGYAQVARPGYAQVERASGTSQQSEDDEAVYNLMKLPAKKQVLVTVRFAKVRRSHLKLLAFIVNGRKNGRQPGDDSTLSGILERDDLDGLTQALAESGAAHILRKQKLTVFSGFTASFLSGGEFPVPTVAGVGGDQETTLSWKAFGTSILFKPTVVDDGLIQLEITPELIRRNHERAAGGVPGLDSKRSSTTVRMKSGQTVILENLPLEDLTQQSDGKPSMLARLRLFGGKKEEAETDSNEWRMVMFFTAETVRQLDTDQVPPLPRLALQPVPARADHAWPVQPVPASAMGTAIDGPLPGGMSRVQKMESAIAFLKSAGLDQLAASVEQELKTTRREAARVELVERQLELKRLQGEIARLSREAGIDAAPLSHFRLNTIVARTTVEALAKAGFKPQKPTFQMAKSTVEVTGLFRKLAANGTLKILSNPVMLVADGKTVRWKDGGEIPETTRSVEDGKAVVTTSFRDVGLNLTLTPHHKDDGTFRLDMVHRAAEHPNEKIIRTSGTHDPENAAGPVQTSFELNAGESLLSGMVFPDGTVELIRVRPELVSFEE